jgi:hypothetical protein
MRFSEGTIGDFPFGRSKFLQAEFAREVACHAVPEPCDNASPICDVMLRARAHHASKAAILTIPALRVSVENRSPA